MTDDGLDVSLDGVDQLGHRWGGTGEDVRATARRIDADGTWAPQVSAAVSGFAAQWAQDLGAVADTADQIRDHLHGCVEAYRRTDEQVGRRLDRLTAAR